MIFGKKVEFSSKEETNYKWTCRPLVEFSSRYNEGGFLIPAPVSEEVIRYLESHGYYHNEEPKDDM